MFPESPNAHTDSLPEREIRYEERNIVRVIALHTAALRAEMHQEMMPPAGVVEQLSRKKIPKDMIPRILNTLATPMPSTTRLIMEFKGGTTSNRRITLAGGGIDILNFGPDDIISEGIRELRTETGHTAQKSLLREDCNRTYRFTMQKGSTIIHRTNHEYLMVAYIPRKQNTHSRFFENENIVATIRLAPQEVSNLLTEETYISVNHIGRLIDNLCLNPDNHSENTVMLDEVDTIRTRAAIEDEVWTYEAYSWKKLLEALHQTTASRLSASLKHDIKAILSSDDFHSRDSAQNLLGQIHSVLVRIEQSYPGYLRPKKHRLSKKIMNSLIQIGVPKNDLMNRMILMEELETAYTHAFHAKKKRTSGR